MPSEDEIEAARTPRGAWTRRQLAAWGVPWPPPSGWKAALINEHREGARREPLAIPSSSRTRRGDQLELWDATSDERVSTAPNHLAHHPRAVSMLARYPTRCAGCPEQIKPGDAMAQLGDVGSGQWVHAACHPDIEVVARALGEQSPSKLAEPGKRAPRQERKGRTSRAAGAPEPIPPGAIEVYTDGACSGNPGPGGWAWAVADGRQALGPDPATTNQRMEIRAALEAVRALDGKLVVVSDSRYVVDCFRANWWRGWISRGWTTTAKKPVANRDLWEPLIELVRDRGDVTFQWVKGHSGHPMNDLVDRLAVAASLMNP